MVGSAPMHSWKKIVLISAAVGAGFAIMGTLIVGVFLWYSSRPKAPTPWDTNKITATFDYIDTEGEKHNLVFYYVLDNHTDFDYRIPDDTGISLTGKLEQQKALSSFGKYEEIDYPVFVPARQRVRFGIRIPYPYPENPASPSTKADRAAYIRDKMSNLTGFVLFDQMNRTRIDFPKGW